MSQSNQNKVEREMVSVSVLSVMPQFEATRVEIEKAGYLKFWILSQFQEWGGNAEVLSLLV